MTTFERFQQLQVELVRAGFETELHARPVGEAAVLTMFADLRALTATQVETLAALTGSRGFSYTVDAESRAAIALATPAR